MAINYKLILGFIISFIGLFYSVYNQIQTTVVLGRTITGIILLILGILIIILKKEKLYFAFFLSSMLTLLKIFLSLIETNFKIVGFIVGDIILFLFLVWITGIIFYYYKNKSKNNLAG